MKKNTFLFLFFTISSFALVSDIYKEVIMRNNASLPDKKTETRQYAVAGNIYAENFESAHGWSFVNGTQSNKWYVGSAVNNGGTKSLYISDNNGVDNKYNTVAPSLAFAYKDIAIPANTSEVSISFDWRCNGSMSDTFNVWILPTTYTPDTNTPLASTGMGFVQLNGSFRGQAGWGNYNTVINLSSYAGGSIRLVFEWSNGGWIPGVQPPGAIDNIALTAITCSVPSNIQVGNITTTTAQASWTTPSATNIVSYDYYISQTNNITDATVPTGNVSTVSVNLENLTSATLYYFWIRSNCGTTDGQSSWTGPFVFSTDCSTFNLPFTETFNSDSSTINCWSVINNNNDEVLWSPNTNMGAFEGDQTAYIQIQNWEPIINDDYLVSPVFNFNGQYRLKYYYKVDFTTDPQIFSVKMSQNGGITAADFTTTVVAEQGYNNTEYVEKIVYLPAFTGQGAFAWYVGNSNKSSIFIDKVVIEPIPACPEPYEVTKTQITDELVSISWQQYGTVASWEVIILPHGQDIPEDLTMVTVYQTTTASITINGLEDITAYDIYVRAICDPSQQSSWSSPLEINTPPINDTCDKAIVLPVNLVPECVESVSGSVKEATPSAVGDVCEGTPYNDVWYEFTAVTEKHAVKLTMETIGFAIPYIAVYEDNICSGQSLMPIACSQADFLSMQGLTIGNTYKVRVYTTPQSTAKTFDICVVTLPPPISVSDTQYTIPELVTEILIDNPCAIISNITWSTGTNYNDVNGIGYFNKNNSSFSFEEGILLSTGKIQSAPGPASGMVGDGGNDWLGDNQLTNYMNDYLNQPDESYLNASILEFDFVALTNKFKFNFIFAADEYGFYQCSFSDAFAFFLTNTTTGVTTNLAIVPETTDPISVVTIRKAMHSQVDETTGEPMCGDANPDYFQACYDPAFNGQNPLTSPINFYGLTVPMVAQSAVVPGTTYHIKLVIQDRRDTSRDSSVFLEGGSFDLGNVELGNDLLIVTDNALCSGETYVLHSGLNAENYNIKWYKDNVLIDGVNTAALEVTESGEYKIEALIPGSTCVLSDTIKVEIYPEIKIVAPKNIEVCVFNQVIPAVDLTVNENEMLSLLSELTDIEVGYYETQAAAELESGAITSPENYQTSELPKEIFVRIDNTKTGCHRIVSFKLVQKVVVNLKKPENIVVCVYDGVRISVDLTTVKAGIVSQLANPDVTLRYYKTYENAINEVGAIASPQNYEPATLPATVYIRFTDRATGCELLTSVEIVASAKLTPMEVEDVLICNKYVVPQLPEGYFYSTEEFGKGQIIKSGTEYSVGSYQIYLNIQNSNGCVFSSSYTVEVIDCSIPKGISPNGDQLNDSFDLTYYHPLEVVIYNRDGREVYSYGAGYSNQWYGQNKEGKPLPDGTYFYKIKTVTEIFTGYVQLVREIK